MVAATLLLTACSSNSPPPDADGQSYPAVGIDFRTEDPSMEDPSMEDAVGDCQRIWASEGSRIVRSMETISGLSFVKPDHADTAIVANIVEEASNSGYQDRPMRLRASYPFDTKRATLVHELGHRLQTHLSTRDEEEHGPLFLWLYDVWLDPWGQTFADEQVAVEKRRGERYLRAWDAALALTREERREAWGTLLDERARE